MNQRLGQIAWWARQGLLTAGAVIGVLCLLMTVGAALFGLRPLVFQSGSMSPTIQTGDLAISHDVDASSLHRGDIVSVPTGTGTRVTHRIVSVSRDGSDAVLRLRGDANKATDATSYRVGHADRVLFHLPRLGYVVGWMSGPMGLFLLGLYAAFLISVLVKKSPGNGSGTGTGTPGEPLSAEARVVPPSTPVRKVSARKESARKANDKGRLVATGGLSVLLAAGALAGVGVQSRVTPTLAAWTDPVNITGATFTSYVVPAPPSGTSSATCAVLPAGSGNEQGVTYSWASGSTGTVNYTTTVSPTTVILTQSTTTTSGGTTTLTLKYDAPKSPKGSQVTVTVQSSVPSAPTWTSSPVTLGKFTTGTQPSSAPTCG